MKKSEVRGKGIIVKMSHSTWMNWPAGRNFEVYNEEGYLLLEGEHEYDVELAEYIDDYDEDGNYDGTYQESGDFSTGHRNYDILDTFTVTVTRKYVKYFPYRALKELCWYFGISRIKLNW